jgi:very-short-patch-repair endonuclease
MAAILAAGPDAVLSHRSAAALWGIRSTSRRRIELTVPRAIRSRSGIEIHRGRLPLDEVVVFHGIPVTTPPRTLLDLASVVPRRHLEHALNEAEVLRLTDPLSVAELLRRYSRRTGTAALKRLIEDKTIGTDITRSELERRFLAFLDDHGLPRPRVNALIEVGGRALEIDCTWPEQRLAVELDDRATHATSAAFERDRARDRILQAAGWRVIRVTWRQLHEEPAAVAEDLRTLTLLRP